MMVMPLKQAYFAKGLLKPTNLIFKIGFNTAHGNIKKLASCLKTKFSGKTVVLSFKFLQSNKSRNSRNLKGPGLALANCLTIKVMAGC